MGPRLISGTQANQAEENYDDVENMQNVLLPQPHTKKISSLINWSGIPIMSLNTSYVTEYLLCH